MSRSAEDAGVSHDDARNRVADELEAALKGIGAAIPGADATMILRLCIAYFADIHAQSFGHTATVKALISIARSGVRFATIELLSLRN